MSVAKRIISTISEKIIYPKNSLGIKRKDMPQIEDADFPDFLSWLRENGHQYESRTIDPNQVKPSQGEIDTAEAQKLLDTKSPKLKKPVIISKDLFVIDGHHRWYAHVLDNETRMPVIKISMDAKKLIKLMNTYDKSKSKSINNESRVAKIFKSLQTIVEKLIIINKGAKSGQIIILAGGGGSGKDFTMSNFMDVSSYKVFDVDELKRLAIAVAKKKGDKEIADLDLRNPSDVAKLHSYVDKKGLESKIFTTMLNSIRTSKELPNLLFNVTLKDMRKITEKLETLSELGYKAADVHLVWVLAEYSVAVDNNKGRSRVVPDDILFQTHKGAAETMSSILKGNIPPKVNGEIYVVFSDKRLSVMQKGKDGGSHIKDFLYAKVKDSNTGLRSEDEIKKQVFSLAKDMVPAEVKNLF